MVRGRDPAGVSRETRALFARPRHCRRTGGLAGVRAEQRLRPAPWVRPPPPPVGAAPRARAPPRRRCGPAHAHAPRRARPPPPRPRRSRALSQKVSVYAKKLVGESDALAVEVRARVARGGGPAGEGAGDAAVRAAARGVAGRRRSRSQQGARAAGGPP
jgi:hypothetical protein